MMQLDHRLAGCSGCCFDCWRQADARVLRTVLTLMGEHDRLLKAGGAGLQGHVVAGAVINTPGEHNHSIFMSCWNRQLCRLTCSGLSAGFREHLRT